MPRQKEKVDHPLHYGGDVPHEVWKCLHAWGLDRDAYLWTTVKYIARAGRKDSEALLDDLRKAKWYLDKKIELLQSKP
jgi:Protein of unknwon function (DUF3310)